MTDQAPAGWFPDPEHSDQLRYWDGSQWTEHRSPRPIDQPAQPTPPMAASAAAAPTDVPALVKKIATKWKIAVGVVVALMIIGALSPDDEKAEPASSEAVETSAAPLVDVAEEETPAADEPEQESTPTPEPTPKVKPASPYGKQPKDQVRFLSAVTRAQHAAEDADNDLQIGAALSQRNQTICRTIGRGAVRNWVGEVSELDANGEGKAIVGIEIADDVHVATWNNFLSDAVDETLIEAGPLFDKVLALQEGQIVRFSGTLVEEMGGDPCVNDSRMTLYGKVSDPEFIFRFTDVAPVR